MVEHSVRIQEFFFQLEFYVKSIWENVEFPKLMKLQDSKLYKLQILPISRHQNGLYVISRKSYLSH